MKPTKRTLVDLAERSLATFAQAFLAVVTLGSLTDLRALKIAAIAGGYALGKFLLVKANAFLASPPPEVPAPAPAAAAAPSSTTSPTS